MPLNLLNRNGIANQSRNGLPKLNIVKHFIFPLLIAIFMEDLDPAHPFRDLLSQILMVRGRFHLFDDRDDRAVGCQAVGIAFKAVLEVLQDGLQVFLWALLLDFLLCCLAGFLVLLFDFAWFRFQELHEEVYGFLVVYCQKELERLEDRDVRNARAASFLGQLLEVLVLRLYV